jgi:transposase-like protein
MRSLRGMVYLAQNQPPKSNRKRRNIWVEPYFDTTNLLERLFGEGRRRSKIVPRFLNEASGLSLMFAVLVDASAGWRGVKINAAARNQLAALNGNSAVKETTQEAA